MVRVQTIETGKMAHTMFVTPWVPEKPYPKVNSGLGTGTRHIGHQEELKHYHLQLP